MAVKREEGDLVNPFSPGSKPSSGSSSSSGSSGPAPASSRIPDTVTTNPTPNPSTYDWSYFKDEPHLPPDTVTTNPTPNPSIETSTSTYYKTVTGGEAADLVFGRTNQPPTVTEGNRVSSGSSRSSGPAPASSRIPDTVTTPNPSIEKSIQTDKIDNTQTTNSDNIITPSPSSLDIIDTSSPSREEMMVAIGPRTLEKLKIANPAEQEQFYNEFLPWAYSNYLKNKPKQQSGGFEYRVPESGVMARNPLTGHFEEAVYYNGTWQSKKYVETLENLNKTLTTSTPVPEPADTDVEIIPWSTNTAMYSNMGVKGMNKLAVIEPSDRIYHEDVKNMYDYYPVITVAGAITQNVFFDPKTRRFITPFNVNNIQASDYLSDNHYYWDPRYGVDLTTIKEEQKIETYNIQEMQGGRRATVEAVRTSTGVDMAAGVLTSEQYNNIIEKYGTKNASGVYEIRDREIYDMLTSYEYVQGMGYIKKTVDPSVRAEETAALYTKTVERVRQDTGVDLSYGSMTPEQYQRVLETYGTKNASGVYEIQDEAVYTVISGYKLYGNIGYVKNGAEYSSNVEKLYDANNINIVSRKIDEVTSFLDSTIGSVGQDVKLGPIPEYVVGDIFKMPGNIVRGYSGMIQWGYETSIYESGAMRASMKNPGGYTENLNKRVQLTYQSTAVGVEETKASIVEDPVRFAYNMALPAMLTGGLRLGMKTVRGSASARLNTMDVEPGAKSAYINAYKAAKDIKGIEPAVKSEPVLSEAVNVGDAGTVIKEVLGEEPHSLYGGITMKSQSRYTTPRTTSDIDVMVEDPARVASKVVGKVERTHLEGNLVSSENGHMLDPHAAPKNYPLPGGRGGVVAEVPDPEIQTTGIGSRLFGEPLDMIPSKKQVLVGGKDYTGMLNMERLDFGGVRKMNAVMTDIMNPMTKGYRLQKDLFDAYTIGHELVSAQRGRLSDMWIGKRLYWEGRLNRAEMHLNKMLEGEITYKTKAGEVKTARLRDVYHEYVDTISNAKAEKTIRVNLERPSTTSTGVLERISRIPSPYNVKTVSRKPVTSMYKTPSTLGIKRITSTIPTSKPRESTASIMTSVMSGVNNGEISKSIIDTTGSTTGSRPSPLPGNTISSRYIYTNPSRVSITPNQRAMPRLHDNLKRAIGNFDVREARATYKTSLAGVIGKQRRRVAWPF